VKRRRNCRRGRSAALAVSGPAAALEPPLGVVAAAGGSTPGEYGEGRPAAGRRFEARRPKLEGAGIGRPASEPESYEVEDSVRGLFTA